MDQEYHALAEKIARRFSLLPEVEAVAVAGSQASGVAGENSDIDVYIYSVTDIAADVRMAIGAEFADYVELNDFWGLGNEWTDRESGIHVDAIFWKVSWIEDQMDRILQRNEAWSGYTTCFWHTVKISQVIYDCAGWFTRLHARAMQDYPEALVKAIIARNYPTLRQIASSYLTQLEKAAARSDTVSLNHRTAALLAGYFDVLFAINHLPHPGEKRQLDFAEKFCTRLPVNLREQVNQVIAASCSSGAGIASAVNALIDNLDALIT